MKWLSAGLIFVNIATVCGLLLGIVGRGLNGATAFLSLSFGLTVAILAYFQTKPDNHSCSKVLARSRASKVCFWLLAACFTFFAFRVFCWLLYIDGNEFKVQSPNNLGDLALHITYVKNFASGVPLWPDNPIYPVGKVRYPAGTDLFNGLLLLSGLDLTRGFILAGLVGSLGAFYALYRWGGSFTVAAFLFNGGLAGFQILQTGKFIDYQADKIAWKSLPLAMFVTQRGLLYALPAGLLLLCQWRAKYSVIESDEPSRIEGESRYPLPFWIELSLYASMPLFHLHTFMALSVVAAFLFLFGQPEVRKQLAILVGAALLPATFLVWVISDDFKASSFLKWHQGWVQNIGEFAMPFFSFWTWNFGVLIPAAIVLFALCISRSLRSGSTQRARAHRAFAFLAPAAFLFLSSCMVKTAPWEWDNIKIIFWAYLIMLPFLWSELIARCLVPFRVGVCVALFFSGFVSLFGGLVTKEIGYTIAQRPEVDGVGSAVRKLPPTARYAAFPTYNHPLLLQGRKVVLGYAGHLWTQGFNYAETERRLTSLMTGAPGWREEARFLGVRYIFWGREEKVNYPTSTRPWEHEAASIASGSWGAIYDLEGAPSDIGG